MYTLVLTCATLTPYTLSSITAVHLISQLIHCYWELNVCFNIEILKKSLVQNSTYVSNFCPLEVVGRGSETQLQVGENLKR